MLNFSTWCDGQMCTLSLEALGTGMFAGKVQLDCVVEPGKSVIGIVGYEVPVDWEELIVEYKGDMLGGDRASFAVVKDE